MILYKYTISKNEDGKIMYGYDKRPYDELDPETLKMVENLKFDKMIRFDIPNRKMITFLFNNEQMFDAFGYGLWAAQNVNSLFENLEKVNV